MNIHSFHCCTLINFLFFTVNLTLADVTSTEAYLKLTDEMRNIIDRNQGNFDSVRWIHGKINIVSTISFKGKGSRVKEQTDEIWYDGSHSRTDILESKFIGEETGPLLLEKDDRGRIHNFSPIPIGYTEIRSVESWMRYQPSMQRVSISPPEQEAKRRLRSSYLLTYQTIMGRTLKELVLSCAEKDVYFTVKSETIDGDDCLLLECDLANLEVVRKIWVVPSKGYCIKKRQLIERGIVHGEYTTTLKEYLPGIWWYDSVKAYRRGGSKGINPGENLELSVQSITINEPIDPKTFTLAGTNIPHGTRVKDQISGLRYVYGTGYELAQQDVDLALAALEDSRERPIKETEDLIDKPSQEVRSKSRARTEDMEKNDPNLSRNAYVEKTGKGFLLSVGLGSGLALSVVAIILIKSKKREIICI